MEVRDASARPYVNLKNAKEPFGGWITKPAHVRGRNHHGHIRKEDAGAQGSLSGGADVKSSEERQSYEREKGVKTEPDTEAEGELPVLFGGTQSSTTAREPDVDTSSINSKRLALLHAGSDRSQGVKGQERAGRPEKTRVQQKEQGCAGKSAQTLVTLIVGGLASKSPAEEEAAAGSGSTYTCPACSKTFSWASNLNRHKKIHAGERSHVWNLCHRAFSQAGHLKKHRMLHTGEKSFACQLCTKAFTTLWHWRAHTLKHTGERNFVCQVCLKALPATAT